MRPALASLLLALFSYPLIVPMLRADADATMPSCCRREGKHHCSMGHATASQDGPAVDPVRPKCSSYPMTSASPGAWNFAILRNFTPINGSLLSYPSIEAQTEAQYRVSFSRSRQKRGPPALLS
jgi:hypothetical protein